MEIDFRLLRQALAARIALISTILLGMANAVLIVFQARILSQVINDIFLNTKGLRDERTALFWLLGIILTRFAVVWGGDFTAGLVAIRVKKNMREILMKHLVRLGPAYMARQHSAEITGILLDGVEALDAYFSQFLPQLVLAAGIPLTILLVVFPMDWLTGLVFILTAPLIPLFMILIGKLSQAVTRQQWVALNRMSAQFLDTIQGLVTLKTLGRSRTQAGVVAQAAERYRKTTMEVLRVTFLSALTLELIATISTAIVAVQIGLRLLHAGIHFQQAFFILLIAPDFYLPLRQLGARFHAAAAGTAAARQIFGLLAEQGPDQVDPSPEANDFRLSPPFTIRLRKVSFRYPDGQEDAVQDVTLALPSGKIAALIGASGAGKTTLARLLMRFLEPQDGQILVDNLSIVSIPAEAWRKQIAWVPQMPYLFNDTIEGNIRISKPDATIEEVRRAAAQARLEDWIETLPEGLQTRVGEHGARLSGGQAQRLALARAFLRDAKLVIMDEPTASLDPQDEALLIDAITRLREGRTVLMIAHRMASAASADQVLVMDGGRLIEAGAPSELRGKGGMYDRLMNAAGESRP
jgi:ATP-binding cassette, subfamily C, bacterial CydD